jgi:hypothetical protein
MPEGMGLEFWSVLVVEAEEANACCTSYSYRLDITANTNAAERRRDTITPVFLLFINFT